MKAVLLVLANYADESFSCFPSQATIAAETELGERTVRRHLAHLEELGLIHRKKRYASGHRTSDRFFLNIDHVVHLPATVAGSDEFIPTTVAGSDEFIPTTVAGSEEFIWDQHRRLVCR